MKFASAIATFVAACALALVAAWWGWRILGPAPVHIEMAAPSDPAAAIIGANLFNRAATGVASAPVDAVLPGDTRLLGIIARPAQQGYALFRLPSGPRLVARGQEIAAGVTLVSVEAEAITIRDGAGERRFMLREPASATTSSARSMSGVPAVSAPVVATSAKGATATCAPPAGFRGNIVRLNAELLGGLSADAGPWRTMLNAVDGGLVVRDSGGFSAMLGLRSGDRIAQANGIALRVPDDVPAAIIRPLMANQGVRIVGSRAGATQELWLANVACAG